MNQKASALVVHVVELLVAGDFSELERVARGQRLQADHMKEAIVSYGRTLVMPPDVAGELNVIQITGKAPPAWSVRCNLWTKEEGRSDLVLDLTLHESADGDASVEIDGILVP